ncbi:MAG: hypothetical protein KME21_15070 [Desmonostoc vinosum HA7617-LM4]|jgi:hypothetical protein|nr:hypothetical protein [Desmonostoc vinosum HA7617-LM4]
MENRLQVQNLQGEELDMELTPEELEELEALKGGGLSYLGDFTYRPFPYGIPADLFRLKTLDVANRVVRY